MSKYSTILFDVDGTLVDSNDAHAEAWVQAFAEQGIDVPFSEVRRCIGMGGDKLMPTVAGIEEETPDGEAISRRRGEIFLERFLPSVMPFRGAEALVTVLRSRGFTLVAASSAKKQELKPLLRRAGAETLMDAKTSSDDAEESKPDPDIVHAALARVSARASESVLIGDTPYDAAAARRAGVAFIGFRCGGWGDADLDGALVVYDGPWALLDELDASPLTQPRAAGS